MRDKLITYSVLGVCVLAVICAPGYRDIVTTVGQLSGQPVILIDPGHGGMDGGAEAADGTMEKDLNLSISLLLQKQLKKQGMRVIMTRSEDRGLYEGTGDASIRTMKTEDMKKRKSIIDETGSDLCVSIHMNSFTEDTAVHGAQVFYPSEGGGEPAAESCRAAKMIQKALNSSVNRDKARAELGKNDVFLLRNITCPTVIVECGFMSSREESRKLRNSSYQAKLAGVIGKSICKYIEGK